MSKLFTQSWYDRVEALLALALGRGAAAQRPSGTFVGVGGARSPDPPPPPGDALFALPNDNTLNPNGPPFAPTLTGINYVWTFPDACRVTRAALHGKAATIGSTNTLGLGGPQAHDFDVFVDGVFVETLFTLGAGETDVDLHASPAIDVPFGSEFQIVIPAATSETGELANFLFSFSIG
jgi:hypothetical protein